jgi:hypothetical protein
MTDESAYALWRDYDGKQWTPKSENITVFPAKKKTRDLLLWPKPSSGDDTWNDVVVKEAGDVPDLAPTPSMRRCG